MPPARWRAAILPLLTVLSLAIAVTTVLSRKGEPTPIATLVDTTGCTWGENALPTQSGATLSAGVIQLKSGLARLRFTSGVELSLEAPAELQLIDPMHCALRSGTLVASVPPEAIGFRVDTATARLIDQGTEFGVVVDAAGHTTDVNVFDGIVDVSRQGTTTSQRLTTGERSVIDAGSITLIDPGQEPEDRFPDTAKDPFQDAVTVTTTETTEGYIRKSVPRANVFDKMFFLKTSAQKPQYNTKVYLGFDLHAVDKTQVRDARLQLQLLRSPRGFASLVPDATFAVYAVNDGPLDEWERDTLRWDTAPGNAEHPRLTDDRTTTLIGRFQVPQGTQTGFFGIEGPQLLQAVKQDGNGILTLLVVRETSEIAVRGLAHAFARSSTPRGLPPTLLLRTE